MYDMMGIRRDGLISDDRWMDELSVPQRCARALGATYLA